MTSPLQKKLQTFIRDNNMTIGELERKAGLRLNAVRNIINGLSKKPSAETLQAVADTFNCSVKDLLGDKNASSLLQYSQYNVSIEQPELFLACVRQFLDVCQQHAYKPTLEKAQLMIGDIYLYSCEKQALRPDDTFIHWIIRRNH